MIKYLTLLLIVLLFLNKNIENFKSIEIWDHLYDQVYEFNRIKVSSNEIYLVDLDLKMIDDINWDWNLSNIIENDNKGFLEFKTFSNFKKSDFKTKNILPISKSKRQIENSLGSFPVWCFLGDNPSTKKREVINLWTTKSRNQYLKPTCVAFSLIEMIQNVNHEIDNYSAEYLFYWIKKEEKKTSKMTDFTWNKKKIGKMKPTLLWRGLEAIYKYGMIYEKELKYINSNTNYPNDLDKKIQKKKKNIKIRGKFRYFYRMNPNANQMPSDIIVHLLKSGPITVVIKLKFNSFYNYDIWSIKNSSNFDIINHVVSDSQKNDIENQAHSILIYGYHEKVLFINNDKNVKFQGGFIFKNSWGDKWGTKGYSWITYDYINKYFYEGLQYLKY